MINPPVSNLHDNFTDLIFRFSGLPAHTADWPPICESSCTSTLSLQSNIKRPIVNIYK